MSSHLDSEAGQDPERREIRRRRPLPHPAPITCRPGLSQVKLSHVPAYGLDSVLVDGAGASRLVRATQDAPWTSRRPGGPGIALRTYPRSAGGPLRRSAPDARRHRPPAGEPAHDGLAAEAALQPEALGIGRQGTPVDLHGAVSGRC
ncbi:hypothetical protein ACFVW9_22335 [Streptomyces sp. NPDC058217]|uniref:hypothetical protein n=1 Tax=Streptomyces sp. NPDC058217 TaxID=3346384 RepID=UPI0036F04A0F